MNADQVIEAYIDDTVRLLPSRQRDDVAAELRALLHEELLGRARDAGRAADETLAVELVRGYGAPNEVAARYHPVWTIVDAADSRSFLRAGIIGGVVILFLGALRRARPGDAEGALPVGLLDWLGLLVVGFGLKNWMRRARPSAAVWKPRDRDHVSRLGTAVLIPVASAIVFLYSAPGWVLDHVFAGRVNTSWAVYTSEFQHWRLPLFIGCWAGLLGVQALAALRGRWTRPTRRLSIGINMVLACLVLATAVQGNVFESSVADRVAQGVLAMVALIYVPSVGVLVYGEMGRIDRGRAAGQAVLVASLVCCLAPRPANAADAVFDSNGVKIRYVTEGQGEPVVLIHGWMADSSMWGRDKAGNTKLDTSGAQGFECIALDCRGHGKSDKPHDPQSYGPRMAEDVVRLLDHLKIERAHLIGYSSGAFIAGNVAARHPGRVLSVVYAGQAPLVEESKAPARPASLGPSEVEVFAKAVDEGKDLGAYIIAVTPAGRPKPGPTQATAIANYLFRGKDVKALAAAGRSFGDLEVTAEDLKKCTAPILFIHGGNESATVKNRVARVHKLLGGDLKVIEGGDHMTTLVKPQFTKDILSFLRSSRK